MLCELCFACKVQLAWFGANPIGCLWVQRLLLWRQCRLSFIYFMGSRHDASLDLPFECLQLSIDASASMHTCCRQQNVGGSEQQAKPAPLCCSAGSCQCRGCNTSAAVCYPQGAFWSTLFTAEPFAAFEASFTSFSHLAHHELEGMTAFTS